MKTIPLILTAILALTLPASAQRPAPPSREAQKLIQSALTDFDAKRYDEALEKVLKLEQEMPDDIMVLNLVGAAYTKKRDFATAQTYFDKALAKDPNFFAAKFNVGEIMFLQRNYQGAYEHFSKMLEGDPRNELLQFKVFLSLLELGKMEEAATALKRIKYPSDTPAWYYGQAVWEWKKGDKKKAAEYVTGARYIFGPKTAIFDETLDDIGVKLR
ncbi:MAG: tetratricopeptide repeat protein [Terrimicrobiaceae bacterium]|nr:tetratricopeptide repeat protein [Terrimicrobiaceae bacterium]